MIESSSPSSSVADTVFDCRVLVGRAAGWWFLSLAKASSPRSWASSDTDILLLRRAWACPALTSFSNTGDGACWRWGNGPFCAVVDRGRLDAGINTSDSVFAMSLPSSSVSSNPSSPSWASRGELVRSTFAFTVCGAERPGPAGTVARMSFARILPRPARGDVAWERRAVRLSTWSSPDEPLSSGDYAESRF